MLGATTRESHWIAIFKDGERIARWQGSGSVEAAIDAVRRRFCQREFGCVKSVELLRDEYAVTFKPASLES